MPQDVRKYFVKDAWKFNLESAYEKLKCLEYELDDGNLAFPFLAAGIKVTDYDGLFALQEEVEELAWVAKTRKVTGREYGRIKQIVSWRVNQRYITCIHNGLPESEAGACFADL